MDQVFFNLPQKSSSPSPPSFPSPPPPPPPLSFPIYIGLIYALYFTSSKSRPLPILTLTHLSRTRVGKCFFPINCSFLFQHLERTYSFLKLSFALFEPFPTGFLFRSEEATNYHTRQRKNRNKTRGT